MKKKYPIRIASDFKYVPALKTDISKTIEREQKRLKELKEQCGNVVPISARQHARGDA